MPVCCFYTTKVFPNTPPHPLSSFLFFLFFLPDCCFYTTLRNPTTPPPPCQHLFFSYHIAPPLSTKEILLHRLTTLKPYGTMVSWEIGSVKSYYINVTPALHVHPEHVPSNPYCIVSYNETQVNNYIPIALS